MGKYIYLFKYKSFQQPYNSILIFHYSTGKNKAENLLQEPYESNKIK